VTAEIYREGVEAGVLVEDRVVEAGVLVEDRVVEAGVLVEDRVVEAGVLVEDRSVPAETHRSFRGDATGVSLHRPPPTPSFRVETNEGGEGGWRSTVVRSAVLVIECDITDVSSKD